MNHQEADTGAGPLTHSAHDKPFKQGFPPLAFEPTLEREFRRALLTASLAGIRRNLWIAAAFVIGISWLTHMLLAPAVSVRLDLIRLCTFGPLLGFAIYATHSKSYHRLYPLACRVGAPVFGVGITFVAVVAAMHGVNLISTVVLATIFIYSMLAIKFHEGLTTALLILVSYLIAATVAQLGPAEMLVDISMLIFANVIGALTCYNLERAHRVHFLESRLLTETASRDGLTGIYNRRFFDEQLDRMWLQAAREQVPLALMLIDIDHFKAYNDCCGHQAGDECLRQVARSLMHCARRPLDFTARYGGEEFAVMLYDASRQHVEEMARHLQASTQALAITHPASPAAGKLLTISIGAACVLPDVNRSHFGFIQLADEALYAAKEQGRDRAVIMDKEYEQLSTGTFRKRTSKRA